jgi:hypothetical protein
MLTLVPNPELLDGETLRHLLRFAPEEVRRRVSVIKSRDEKARSLVSWLALIYAVRKENTAVPDDPDIAYDEYG